MAFKYTPIGSFRINTTRKSPDGKKKKKQTIQIGYIVQNTGLSFTQLVVHLVPGSKTQWTVSERFTGAKVSEKSASNKDTAVREAIARIKIVGRVKFQEAIANCS